MSILKILQQQSETEEEIEELSESESYSDISDNRKQDIQRFLDHLKQKEKNAIKIAELAKTQNNYFCICCDFACESQKEIKLHEETEQHKVNDKQYRSKEYNFGGYEKRKRNNSNKLAKAAIPRPDAKK